MTMKLMMKKAMTMMLIEGLKVILAEVKMTKKLMMKMTMMLIEGPKVILAVVCGAAGSQSVFTALLSSFSSSCTTIPGVNKKQNQSS